MQYIGYTTRFSIAGFKGSLRDVERRRQKGRGEKEERIGSRREVKERRR